MPPESPLVSARALQRHLGASDLRVVDVRWYLGQPDAGRDAYRSGHLPGAIFLDLETDLSAPTGPGRHPLPQPEAFARRLGDIGIGDDDLVVAYDDVGGWVAARLWWMLDVLGHRNVAVLDGGLPGWVSAGYELSTEVPHWPPATLSLRGSWARTIDRDQLLARLGSVLLLDARAGPRYRGETEPVDPVAGHIPTAVNHPTAENLGPDERFLPARTLVERFEALGAVDRVVVTSCGSGVSACHHALAMRVAGLPDPILYPGSWSDWSRAGFPVGVGPDPGERPLARRGRAR